MIADADALFFSSLAYHGSDTATAYNTLLSNNGHGQWTWQDDSDHSAPNSDSYYGIAFRNKDTNEIVIANRGSGSLVDWGVTDWDVCHHVSDIPAFDDALVFANEVINTNVDSMCFVTGHSIGGAEAEYQAAETGLSGTTFSAPGMAWLTPGRSAPVSNITFFDEPIGNFGDPVGSREIISPTGGRIELTNALGSAAIDALATDVVDAVRVYLHQPTLPNDVTGLIGLHTRDNYLEYYGLPQSMNFDYGTGEINSLFGLGLALLPIQLVGSPTADAIMPRIPSEPDTAPIALTRWASPYLVSNSMSFLDEMSTALSVDTGNESSLGLHLVHIGDPHHRPQSHQVSQLPFDFKSLSLPG